MRAISQVLKPDTLAHASTQSVPRRPKRKQTRLFIDNEYFERRYAATFPHSVTLVYCVLARHANADDQTCFPSAATISRLAGCSRQTAFRGLRKLEAHRIVVLLRRGGGRLSNLYGMVASSAWLPIHTEVRRELAGASKEARVRYQNEVASSLVPRTRTHITKSTNRSQPDFQEKEGYEETTVISAIQKHRSDWKEEDIIRALMKAYRDGVRSPRIFTDNALIPYLEKAATELGV